MGSWLDRKDLWISENLGLMETQKLAADALPRSGGEVTGNITISTDTEIAWRRNTDMAAIGFKNTGDADTDSYMWFKTADNGNEYFKWQHSLSGGGTTEWMSLKSDNLRVKGHQVYHEGYKPSAADIGAFSSSGGKVAGIIHADNWIMGKELWERDPKNGKEERIYSPFNKPSASDIGAASVNDAMRITYLDGWNNIYNGYSGFGPEASFLKKYNIPTDFGVQLRFSNVNGASNEGEDQIWSHRLIFMHRGNTYRTDHINKNEIFTRKFWDDNNAKPDNNGFLRISSPIIEVYSDGTCITNNESEGATVTKINIGHYKISGILGYTSDKAWGVYGGISSPKNNNGLELIYIDDKVKKRWKHYT
ncbi:hypothetical protein PXH59_10555 [Xenorhabdus sp. SF857]|uniref:phage tail fiber protein n=1 Tax=Xenorhabdus bakwenae TaxID=3026967 RepID=UPI0025580052|nr:hypothetical protein [Xenorhabdus sp. SF857]WFQ78220.1 hypothetical protein PXH59_10555 [Xenorhabdus sp. SF857]